MVEVKDSPYQYRNGETVKQGDLIVKDHGNNYVKTSVFQVYHSKSLGWIIRSEDGVWFPLDSIANRETLYLLKHGTMKEDGELFFNK